MFLIALFLRAEKRTNENAYWQEDKKLQDFKQWDIPLSEKENSHTQQYRSVLII